MTTWAYDVAGNKWGKLPIKKEDQPCPRWRFGITYDSRNEVVILTGGSNCTWDKDEAYYRDVWVFDPRTDKWADMKPGGAVPQVRERESRHCGYDERSNAVLFLTSRTGLWAYRYRNAPLKKVNSKGP
ncbi:MAG: kelch repeat-containing protein [Planctomycetota bacterium]